MLRRLVGRCHAQLGHQDAASAILLQAVECACRDEQHSEAVQALMLLAEQEMDQGHLDVARRLCGRALSQAAMAAPRDPGLLLLCGRLALASRKPEEANRWYTEAVQILSPDADPRAAGLAEAHRALANLAEAAGDMELALVHWKAAMKGQHE